MEEYFERCTIGPPFKDKEKMKYEFCRFLSFNSWPKDSPVFPLKLARAGFYFNGYGDEVTCFMCGAVKSEWFTEDEPFEIHRQLNAECPVLIDDKKEINIPLSMNVAGQEDSSLIQRLNNIIRDREDVNAYECSNIDDMGGVGVRGASGSSGRGTGVDTEVSADFQPPEFDMSSDERSTESPESTLLRSQSLQNLQDVSKQGLQNETLSESRSSTFPDTSREGENPEDSAVMLDKGASGSTSPEARNYTLNLINTKSKEDKKKDILAKKSKGKKEKQSLKTAKSTSSSRSGSETNIASQRNQDIPPPTGESIGPLRFERNRQQTFQCWPGNACVPAVELAKCGFFYTGSGDRVQCIFCKGVLRNWEEGDRPHIEHRKHFPRCPLVLGLKIGNVPLPLDQKPASTSSQTGERQNTNAAVNVSDSFSNIENLGIITDRPKHPLYAIESQRLASFQSWPPYKHQTPQHLAEAGFWYAGFNDNVKCFYCDGGLRNWEPGDEPWKEHARWFPKCPFVIQVKSQEFVKNVLKEKQVEIPANTNNPGTAAATSEQFKGKYKVEEREIRARMDSPHIRKVLDLGISRTVVMNTLRKRLRETGDDFPSITSLMEAVFKEEVKAANRQSWNPLQTQNSLGSVNASEKQIAPNDVQSNAYSDVTQFLGNEECMKRDDKTSSTNDRNGTVEKEMPSAIHVQADDLMKENLELKEQRLCKICMASDANVVFLPCGHLVSCATCAPALQLCPICRSSIKGTVRTYIA